MKNAGRTPDNKGFPQTDGESSVTEEILNTAGRRDSVEPFVTYRQTDTGVWSYHCYAGRQQLGKISCAISMLSTVEIGLGNISWYSTFHMDTQVVPGISRKVMDNRTGLEVFRVIYCEPGFYRIMGEKLNLLVEYRDNAYLFGNPGQPVLAATERIREWPWVPVGEPFFQTKIYEERLDAELLSAMLAFPALRF